MAGGEKQAERKISVETYGESLSKEDSARIANAIVAHVQRSQRAIHLESEKVRFSVKVEVGRVKTNKTDLESISQRGGTGLGDLVAIQTQIAQSGCSKQDAKTKTATSRST